MPSKHIKVEPRILKRQSQRLSSIEKKIIVFCEGEKTEPQYFEEMKNIITQNAVYRNVLKIDIIGIGEGGAKVSQYAIDYAQRNNLKNTEIWCVFDKDDLSNDIFNRAIMLLESQKDKTKNIEFHAAWSNECIEYWFILHFDYYDSDNHRAYYESYLTQKFQDACYIDYLKNSPRNFDMLLQYGDPKKAFSFAKRRMSLLSTESPAQRKPATNVYLLVEKLAQYLPEEVKTRFI